MVGLGPRQGPVSEEEAGWAVTRGDCGFSMAGGEPTWLAGGEPQLGDEKSEGSQGKAKATEVGNADPDLGVSSLSENRKTCVGLLCPRSCASSFTP